MPGHIKARDILENLYRIFDYLKDDIDQAFPENHKVRRQAKKCLRETEGLWAGLNSTLKERQKNLSAFEKIHQKDGQNP